MKGFQKDVEYWPATMDGEMLRNVDGSVVKLTATEMINRRPLGVESHLELHRKLDFIIEALEAITGQVEG